MADPDPKPPNLDPPPKPVEDLIRPKKYSKKSKSEAKSSLKKSNDVSKSSQVSFKKGFQRSVTRSSGSEESMGDVGGSEEGLSAKKVKVDVTSVGNERDKVRGNIDNNKVSILFPEVEPTMPVPFDENPVLNPKLNSNLNTSVNAKNVGVVGKEASSGCDSNVGQGMKKSEFVVGESSKSNDVVMQENTTFNKPLSFSNAVQAMCERANGRANFARVLVEIDATKGIIDVVDVCYKSLGRFMQLKVEYDWRPPACSHCKVFGHNFKDCNKREVNVEEKLELAKAKSQNDVGNTQNAKDNNGWQAVQGRRNNRNDGIGNTIHETVNNQYEQQRSRGVPNYYRGGLSQRGRGGVYARGGFNGVRANGESRNATTNSSGNVKVPKADEVVKQDKQKEKINTNVSGNNVAMPKETISTNNKFGVLVDENENNMEDESQNMKLKIDVACDLGIDISEEEKKGWNKELPDYYKLKSIGLKKNKRKA
ncbi:DUF4283 domain-containing protein [Artemisia annua]|uniref:DUF4283 domain-containing protein n=1 Tax=Artemisia annua TaxID=35608 RepID=A0A2U1PHB6_ARTAN|nr:DUF4283 domain-containing protein [Artemisia annua]